MVSSGSECDASSARHGPGARLLLLLVEAYRLLLSPLLGGHCRFWPSCSTYAVEAIQRHGAWRGAVLSARRVLMGDIRRGVGIPVGDVPGELEDFCQGLPVLGLIGGGMEQVEVQVME